MKKALSLLLVIVLCLSVCACGQSSADNEKSTEPTITLEPLTEFPAYSKDFQTIADNISVDQQVLENFFGYAYAAYNAYDAKGFCEYVYTDLDFAIFENIKEDIAVAATSDVELSLSLTLLKTDLVRIASLVASSKLAYAEVEAGQSDSTYESVKEMTVSALNEYARFVYGKDILVPGE